MTINGAAIRPTSDARNGALAIDIPTDEGTLGWRADSYPATSHGALEPGIAGRTVLIAAPSGAEPERLQRALELDGGLRTDIVGTAGDALDCLERRLADLMLVSADLPDIAGHGLCRSLRARRSTLPIIVVGGSSEADLVLALEAGADDAVLDPVSVPLLLARIRAQLRRQDLNESADLVFGACRLSPGTRVVHDIERRRRIRLTDRETSLLKYLFRADGRTVLRDELLREVWGFSEEITTHVVESHVYRLRHKIEPDPGKPSHLVTRPGGYALMR